jgi:hypothetical protein
MERPGSNEQKRLLHTLDAEPFFAAPCLPWLPTKCAATIARVLAANTLFLAFAAYIKASPVTRTNHADILSALMRRSEPGDLADLTRLAVASSMDAAWAAVVRLLSANPTSALHIVTAAPWDDLRVDVQETILSAADTDNICAAIAFTRGARPDPPAMTRKTAMTWKTARAFFAAVTPAVWNTLTEGEQRAWGSALGGTVLHRVVRSLGLDPAFLAEATHDVDLIAAVRCHVPDEDAMRGMLLPIAVRDLPLAAISRTIAALPPPPDPAAFVQIAGGIPTMPSALRDWIAANPTPQATVGAITALRVAMQRDNQPDHCHALAHALEGWSWQKTNALLDALPNDARIALRPDPDVLARRLTRCDRKRDFRQTLDALAALSPSVTLPALLALGDCFLVLVDTLANAPRRKILPLPRSATRATAVHAIAAADPLAAHRLAHALRCRTQGGRRCYKRGRCQVRHDPVP